MRIAIADLGPISDDQFLRVVGIQLISPITRGVLTKSDDKRLLVWRPDAADEQRRRVDRVLKKVLEEQAENSLRIIAFPEYCVPKPSDGGLAYQNFVNVTGCVLIPGAYQEHEPAQESLYRRNVCKIYLPGRPPIILVKENLMPREAELVVSAKGAPEFEPWPGPTSAQLVWERSSGQKVSVNIFVCRDYLSGLRDFDRCTTCDEETRAADAANFAHEGLNLVIMHSPNTRLFEGVGGIDLRGLRGERRQSIFVNAAATGSPLGSALIGASSDRADEGDDAASDGRDVVCSVPADAEGVITAAVRLWGIQETTVKPDKAVDCPIDSALSYRIVDDSDGEINFVKADPQYQTTLHRAIWSPAFLAAIEGVITLEFYSAKDLSKVIEIIKSKRAVQKVYAGVVRGVHDVFVRRYVRASDLKGDDPDFTAACSDEVRKQLQSALYIDDAARQRRDERSSMNVIVRPEDILKYRGRTMENGDWKAMVRSAKKALGRPDRRADMVRRRKLINRILGFAEKCAPNFVAPKDIEDCLFDQRTEGIERVNPFGPGTDIRETYVFLVYLTRGPGEGRVSQFEEELLPKVQKTEIVREIFRINDRFRTPFSLVLKLKCKSQAADDLIEEIRILADCNALDFRTRTIDVSHYLAQSSLAGMVDASFPNSAVEFVDRVRSGLLDSDFKLLVAAQGREEDHELLLEIAEAWDDATYIAGDQGDLPNVVFDLYSRLLLHVSALKEEGSERFLEKVQEAWFRCYARLAPAYTQAILAIYLSGEIGTVAKPHKQTSDSVEAVRLFLFGDKDNPNWEPLSKDVVRLYYATVRKLVIQKKYTEETVDELKQGESKVTTLIRNFRNQHAHPENIQAFAPLVDLTGADWCPRLHSFHDSVRSMIELRGRVLRVEAVFLNRRAEGGAERDST